MLVLEVLTDDIFGAAATNVHDEALVVALRESVCNTKINQTSFFLPCNDLDFMAEGFAGGFKEVSAVFGIAEGIGANGSDILGGDVANQLTKAFKAGDACFKGFRGEVAFFVQP